MTGEGGESHRPVRGYTTITESLFWPDDCPDGGPFTRFQTENSGSGER